jgi:hypothetical protein
MATLMNGGGGASAPTITPIFSDLFTSELAAGSVNGSASEPGPGNRVVVDAENKLALSGGALVFSGGKASPAYGDPGFARTSEARANGVTYSIKVTLPDANKHQRFGFFAGAAAVDDGEILHLTNTGTISVRDLLSQLISTYSATTYYISIVLRSVGAFYFIKGGVFTDWSLLWVSETDASATLTPRIVNYNGGGAIDRLSIDNLGAPFDTDYGYASQRLVGARSAGDLITHAANCRLRSTVVTLPSAGAIEYIFRKQDAQNYWLLSIATTGIVTLYEVVNNTPTSRAVGGDPITNGQSLVIIANGQVIQSWLNSVKKIDYTSATNFATATSGALSSLGTGGAVSDLVSWPINPTGTALAKLNLANP